MNDSTAAPACALTRDSPGKCSRKGTTSNIPSGSHAVKISAAANDNAPIDLRIFFGRLASPVVCVFKLSSHRPGTTPSR